MKNRKWMIVNCLAVIVAMGWIQTPTARGGFTSDVIRAEQHLVVGTNSVASGTSSMAQGEDTEASGNFSHSEGELTEASGHAAHAEGGGTVASGDASHAEGVDTIADGYASHAAGENASAIYDNTFVWSDGTSVGSSASNQFIVYAGNGIWLLGGPVTGNGSGLTNLPGGAIAAGSVDTARLADGAITSPKLAASLRVSSNLAVGSGAASGAFSTAFGYYTSAAGQYSHAEGIYTTASGQYSHAEGFVTLASGQASHAAGYNATAAHDNSYVWSDGTSTSSTTTKQYTIYASNGIRLLGGPTEIAYILPQGDLQMGSFTNGLPQ